ncbi:MAG TPA: glycosyltransferase family 4 protein [Actinomycetota bacterium]|nr:glycosyltransferase family 4 protein [Actinomycetota bacterium]
MRILLWHGYLMRGSGSNIYTANVARAWRKAGHDVLVMCQERTVSGLDFIDAAGDFAPDNSSFSTSSMGVAPASGSCVVVRPDIGGLLPVYVYDDYEGFEVKRFVDLTDAELARYTETNVAAMRTAVETHAPDAIITGHEVMGPHIARLACEAGGKTYIAKLHGSALEYAVKEQERYREFAIDGLGGAARVVGGSSYMIEEAARFVPGWRERAQVVNPGCDIDLFRPQPRPDRSKPIVGFVGKLIAQKGVHHLLAAAGLVEREFEVAIVGYGGFETELRELALALGTGDIERALRVAENGPEPLEELIDFLRSVQGDGGYRERAGRRTIDFLGRLDHEALAPVLPTFDLLVVPSVLPEAFGMVAAEAAACGVLPLVPDHSGIGEVGRILEGELGTDGLLTFDPESPIKGIAAGMDRLLGAPPADRRTWAGKAVDVARSRWSWTRVADRLLELASG